MESWNAGTFLVCVLPRPLFFLLRMLSNEPDGAILSESWFTCWLYEFLRFVARIPLELGFHIDQCVWSVTACEKKMSSARFSEMVVLHIAALGADVNGWSEPEKADTISDCKQNHKHVSHRRGNSKIGGARSQ